jgi:hypothetical protein
MTEPHRFPVACAPISVRETAIQVVSRLCLAKIDRYQLITAGDRLVCLVFLYYHGGILFASGDESIMPAMNRILAVILGGGCSSWHFP